MIDFQSPILVAGAGSIGERHLSVLQKLGYQNLWVFRHRNLPLRTIDARTVQIFTDFKQVDEIKPQAAFICGPTSVHLAQASILAEKGIHLLIEKPLTHLTTGIDALIKIVSRSGIYVRIAYMLRFHPWMQQVKKIIEEKPLGNLLNIQTHWGEYLPDWHPWEDYRNSYAAVKDLGGGAALTLSHDIDLANWLAGAPAERWNTLMNFRSELEIKVESSADINIAYANGVTAHCHMNYFERFPRRQYLFLFDGGSIEVDYLKAQMITNVQGAAPKIETLKNFLRNNLFESQAHYFFSRINSGGFVQETQSNLEESRTIIKICTEKQDPYEPV